MPAEPAFVLRGVTKMFGGNAALTDVDLRIERGEHVALVGPSGAGKSTLIGLLNGSLHPTRGEVCTLGHDLTRLSRAARRGIQREIGTIYQQFHLVNNLRVIHNVNAGHLGRWSFVRALVSMFWPLEIELACSALAEVGIPEKLYEVTGHLSGGQQQRVALARALVQDPQILLADEPIASLDPERGRELMDLLRRVSRQAGKTLVTSIHAVDFARSHFDRVIGLRHGRIAFDCPAHEVTGATLE
ncbi:MAG TPA: phosphonate ABC transporter ATP-binding protein, partial [Kofleriaceae bacterium]|nr:phosphonate ABC transporter ATP-binding protein [Kofleriaceae bacterium]